MPGFGRFAILIMLAVCAAAVAVPLSADEARDRYLQVLLDRPDRGVAFEHLYQSYVDHEGVDALLGLLRQRAKDQPHRSASWLIAGFVHERAGDEQAALDAYAVAADHDPTDYRPHAASGTLLWRQRRLEPAAQALRRALSLDPDRDAARHLLMTLGRVYAAAADDEQAAATWMQLRESFGDDSASLEQLADLLVELGRIDDAIIQYDKLRQPSRDDNTRVRATFALADLRLDQQRFDAALELLSEQLGQLAPNSWLRAEALRRIEDALRRQGNPNAALEFYAAWIREHPDDVGMRLAQAKALGAGGKIDDAIAALTAIIEQAPSQTDARVMLAQLYLDQGFSRDAVATVRHMIERQPQHAPAHLERIAELACRAGDFDTAQQAAARLIELTPDREDGYLLGADVYHRAGRDTDAIALLRRGVRRIPRAPRLLAALTWQLSATGQTREAIRYARTLADLRPDDPAIQRRLAELLYDVGRVDEAMDRWPATQAQDDTAGSSSRPPVLLPRPHRVTILQRMVREKHFDSAAPLALDILRERSGGLLGQGGDEQVTAAVAALRAAGVLNDAVTNLERRFDADPASLDITAQLWQLYTATDKPRQASALLERFFNASPNAVVARMRYADALAQRGDYPAAQPHYERILRDDPFLVDDNGWLIAYAFHEAGKLDQFIALIEQIPPLAPGNTPGSAPGNTPGASVALTQDHYRWIFRIAGQLEQLDANAALKIYLHLRKVDAAGKYQTLASDAATRLAPELGQTDQPVDTATPQEQPAHE